LTQSVAVQPTTPVLKWSTAFEEYLEQDS